MNNFDDMIKEQAQKEAIITPIGFDKRIDQIMANLLNKKIRKIRKSSVLIASSLMIFFTVIAFAAPTVLGMVSGTINYFNAPKDFRYLSKQAEYERYNSEVGLSITDQGITLTLDNIAVDDNYINIFYTIKNEQPIQVVDTSAPWAVDQTAPHFWFRANNKYIKPAAQRNIEAYLVDEYTLKGMQRFSIMTTLDETVELELYSTQIFNITGDWHIAVAVDKSNAAANTLTVTPNIERNVDNHKITVEKVSISPFGNQIVLSERHKNPLWNFALRDENGEYLTVIPSSMAGGSAFREATNSFEFIGGSIDMKELTIIPILDATEKPEAVSIEVGAYPLEMPISKIGGLILENLTITTEKAVATFRSYGVIQNIHPLLKLLDEDGNYLDFGEYMEYDYNRETNLITVTQTFGNVNEADIAKIKKIGYFKRNLKLDENNAIVINLKEE